MVNEAVNYLMHPLESLFKGATTVSSNRERAHSLVSSQCMGTVASSFHNLTHDTSVYILLFIEDSFILISSIYQKLIKSTPKL